MISISEKELKNKQRETLKDEINNFLNQGGKITICEPGLIKKEKPADKNIDYIDLEFEED